MSSSSIWPNQVLPLRIEWTWEQYLWRGTPHSPKLQDYWSLTIRWFSVISSTPVGGVLPLCRDAVGVFCSPSGLGCMGLWDTTRRRDPVLINKKKKNLPLSGFSCYRKQPSENEIKQKDKYLDLARELEKAVEYEGDSDTNRSWCTCNGL